MLSSEPFSAHNSSTGGTGRTKWHPWNYLTLISTVPVLIQWWFLDHSRKCGINYNTQHSLCPISVQVFCSPWKCTSTRGTPTCLLFNIHCVSHLPHSTHQSPVVTICTSGLCVLQVSHIKQQHLTTQLSQLPTTQHKVNLLQIMQVKFRIKRIHIALASKATYSQHTVCCWDNQISDTSAAKNIQSNGRPFKSRLHCTLDT
jgi:hypothetical protein